MSKGKTAVKSGGKPQILTFSLLGAPRSGKSALLTAFINDTFSGEYDPVIYNEQTISVCVDGNVIRLQLFDTNGNAEFDAMTDHLLQQSQGAMVCFALNDRSTFEQVMDWASRAQSVETGGTRKFAVLLVGCKADLEKRAIGEAEVRNRAMQMNCSSIETSAQDRLRVKEAFNEIVREYRRLNKTGGDGTTRGYLIKAGSESGVIDRGIKSKQRWFKLSGHQLDYWETEEHECAGKKTLGSLNIMQAVMTDTDDDLTFRLQGSNMSSKKKPYYLTAENKEEHDKWKAALNYFFDEHKRPVA